jgi:hypothetical protein
MNWKQKSKFITAFTKLVTWTMFGQLSIVYTITHIKDQFVILSPHITTYKLKILFLWNLQRNALKISTVIRSILFISSYTG